VATEGDVLAKGPGFDHGGVGRSHRDAFGDGLSTGACGGRRGEFKLRRPAASTRAVPLLPPCNVRAAAPEGSIGGRFPLIRHLAITMPTALRCLVSMSLAILAAAALTSAAARADDRFTVLVIGDSLSAAYGMATEEGWVALLGERLAGRDIEVVNHSISGDTTAGGAGRLGSALARIEPDVVIIELGANDGLRGISPPATEDNLARMIAMSREGGANVLLLGMRMPPNYGPEYTEAFAAVFPRLADR